MIAPQFTYEKVPGFENVFRISLPELSDSQAILKGLQEIFDTGFKNGDYQFVVDLKNVQYPASSLIAFLVEVTSRARRMKGDVKIINLSHTAKNNLATFSPVSYLSLEDEESYALQEFREAPRQLEETLPEEILTAVDIVEDPIVERLHSSIDTTQSETQKKTHHLRVKSVTKNLYNICDFVTGFAEKAGFNAREIGKTKIAVYEACLNVIEHAYHSNPDNWIDIYVDHDEERFTVVIQDYGIGFAGFSHKDYDVVSAMNGRQTGGFGLYIIRRAMDELDYVPDEVKGNRLTMVKYITH